MVELERRAYNLAFFWKISPLELLSIPIDRLYDMEKHAVRIMETRR